MATKKPTTKKSSTSRAAAVKTTVKKKPVKKKVETSTVTLMQPAPVRVTPAGTAEAKLFPDNLATIILAEILGTFILTLVVLTTASMGVLYIGLAFAVLALAFGAISGAHFNPAVTFGLWIARKVKGIMVPVYMLAQFVGALFAIGIFSAVTGGAYGVNLIGSFMTFNPSLFAVELIGTAIFLLGVATVMGRDDLSAGAKALGVGLALFVGLVASGSLLSVSQNTAYQKYQKAATSATAENQPALPRELLIKGAVLNPAIAMAVNESTEAQLMGSATGNEAAAPSRFGLEVLLGTLVGAAMGGGLYLLMAYSSRQDVL
jgi:aquaporin Z